MRPACSEEGVLKVMPSKAAQAPRHMSNRHRSRENSFRFAKLVTETVMVEVAVAEEVAVSVDVLVIVEMSEGTIVTLVIAGAVMVVVAPTMNGVPVTVTVVVTVA